MKKTIGVGLGLATAVIIAFAGQAGAEPNGNRVGSAGTGYSSTAGSTGSTDSAQRATSGPMDSGSAAAPAQVSSRALDTGSSEQGTTVQGRVESVDDSDHPVKLSGIPQPFKLVFGTKIEGGRSGGLDDIKAGDEVRASLNGAEDGAPAISKLHILSNGAGDMGSGAGEPSGNLGSRPPRTRGAARPGGLSSSPSAAPSSQCTSLYTPIGG